MCDPATITGLVLSGASAAVNAAAQSKVQRARDDALAAERVRQNQLDQEAQAMNAASQDRFTGFDAKQEDRSGKLADYFKGQDVPEPAPDAALPASGSNITVKEESKQRAKAKDQTDRQGDALGQLRSFGDLLGDVSRLQGRDASAIGQVGGFKRGSSGVLSYELDAANKAGDGLRPLGDILSGAGMLVGSGALSGMFAPKGNVNPNVSPAAYGTPGSRSLGAALDRASVPGYAGYGVAAKSNSYSPYGGR